MPLPAPVPVRADGGEGASGPGATSSPTSIGTWTTGANDPGQEAAWVDEGLFRTWDACAPAEFFEVYYGATTAKGYTVLSPVPLSVFTDLADNGTVPLAGPYSFPLVGSIQTTDRVIFLTTP